MIVLLTNETNFDAVVHKLWNRLQLSMSNVVTLLPWRPHDGRNLSARLDTRLYLYEKTGGNHIRLWERYSIKSENFIRRVIGDWDGTLLDIPTPNIWERRSNLGGVRLLNGVMDWGLINKFSSNQSVPIEDRLAEIFGIFPAILNNIAAKLNFTLTNVLPNDGKWGGLEEDGVTWNGLIRMLLDEASAKLINDKTYESLG